jgi:hypothetical protein
VYIHANILGRSFGGLVLMLESTMILPPMERFVFMSTIPVLRCRGLGQSPKNNPA